MIARLTGRHVLPALAALVCALLMLPASALANGTGGGGLGGGTGTGTTGTGTTGTGTTGTGTTGTGTTGTGTTGTGTTSPSADPTAPVSASGDGVTLQTTSSALQRGGLVLTGTASGAAGQTLEIQSRAPTAGASWQSATQTTVAASGSFRAVWRTNVSGKVAVRALVVSGSQARTAAAPPTLTVTVYPTSTATIYGPGFYGRQTACHQRLTESTIGVANRTLPCGTKVSILYDGHTLTVPVIDRGPYANGASWDLTTATAQALGMQGTSQIGTVALGDATVTTDTRSGRR